MHDQCNLIQLTSYLANKDLKVLANYTTSLDSIIDDLINKVI